jgi:DNA-directed RNA polymerase specialized sigma24 family protein
MPSNGEDFVSAPAGYAELHAQYYSFVCGLVRKLGIIRDVEDVASEILLRFYERDMLAEFDPDMVIEHGKDRRPARFKSFLSGFVAVYVQHHRDRQNSLAKREPLKCNQPVGESGAEWIEIHGGSHVDDMADLEERELVADMRQHIVTVPRRSRADVCDLPALFDAVVLQVRTTGVINTKELQVQFGVSNTAIHSWLKHMREQLRPLVDQHRALV